MCCNMITGDMHLLYTVKHDYEKEDIDMLMKVLKLGCGTRIVEKNQLPTSICSLNGMMLWNAVLKTNDFHGIELRRLNIMHTVPSLLFVCLFV